MYIETYCNWNVISVVQLIAVQRDSNGHSNHNSFNKYDTLSIYLSQELEVYSVQIYGGDLKMDVFHLNSKMYK